MKRIFRPLSRGRGAGWGRPLAILGTLSLLFLAAGPARTGTLEAAHIRETVFPNGLRLIVKEAHATELAAVQLWVRAGSFTEGDETSGLAHVVEHLVFKGSGSRGSGMLDQEVESLGGLMEASTEKDWTRFNCTVAGRYVERILNVVGELVLRPDLRAEDLEAEKPLILEEIQRARTSPEPALTTLLYELAFERHPYRLDARGNPRQIAALGIEAVREYYRRWYTPANMVLVVVGDVDGARVSAQVRRVFQTDQPANAARPPLPEDELAGAQPRREVLPTPFRNGYVGLAFPAPSVKQEPDVYAMDLIYTLLDAGGTGRLARSLRGRAGVDVVFQTRRQPGLMTIIAATPDNGVDQVEALIRREIDQLRLRAVPEAELTLAKRALRGSFAQDNEPYAGQASTLGFYAAIDRWQFVTEYLGKVEAVTAEQLLETARKYLHPDRTVAVLFRPRRQPGEQGGGQ